MIRLLTAVVLPLDGASGGVCGAVVGGDTVSTALVEGDDPVVAKVGGAVAAEVVLFFLVLLFANLQ